MEFVFVVPRADLFRDCYPQGLVPFGRDLDLAGFEGTVERRGFFVERDHAEENPDLKQIIPYSIVVGDGGILLMRRLAKGGENRLRDKLSIGVGGHINPEDVESGSDRNPIAAGTRREVDEELAIDGSYDVRAVGLLNDDSNAVGAVHLGLVQLLRLQGSVRIREEDVLEGRLVSLDELRALKADGANFETWSSILIDHLDGLIPVTLAAST